MKWSLTLLSLGLVILPVHAVTFTNDASADAFVRAAAPKLNYGGAGAISISGPTATNAFGETNGIFDGFIRFNTLAMVTNFNSRFGSNNWSITGVTLCVNEQGVPNNALFNRGVGAFEIFWITNDNWVEGTGTPNSPATTGINYDDEATLLSSGADLSLGTWTNAGVDGPLSFPLALPTGFVGDLRNGGEVGLYLTALDPGTGFTFMSRSFGTPSMQPVLEVSAASRPVITSIRFSGTDIVLTAANGVAGGTCCTLASTNVTLPLSQWTPVMTNVLATDGDFVVTLTNAVNAGTLRQQFFMLQAE